MEVIVRASIFAGLLLFFMALESLIPRRERKFTRLERWPSNFMIVVIDNLILRLVPWLLPVRTAAFVSGRGIGLLGILNFPVWLEFTIALVLLDMVIYWQHRIFHIVPLLRRVHRMHHLEQDLDVTSALRFHPLEILVSLFIKITAVFLVGVNPGQILVFEVLLNGMAMFNHTNMAIPNNIDRILRVLFVTPDMHRIHHSTDPFEANSNYGFNLSVWDYLFRSYTREPKLGQIGMNLGHRSFLDPEYNRLNKLLINPFV